jgi:hypothetical protein
MVLKTLIINHDLALPKMNVEDSKTTIFKYR